jgi:hypothetical protein
MIGANVPAHTHRQRHGDAERLVAIRGDHLRLERQRDARKGKDWPQPATSRVGPMEEAPHGGAHCLRIGPVLPDPPGSIGREILEGTGKTLLVVLPALSAGMLAVP